MDIKGKESSRTVALLQQTSEGNKSWHEPTVTTTVLSPFCLPREPKRWENNTALSLAFGVWQQKKLIARGPCLIWREVAGAIDCCGLKSNDG